MITQQPQTCIYSIHTGFCKREGKKKTLPKFRLVLFSFKLHLNLFDSVSHLHFLFIRLQTRSTICGQHSGAVINTVPHSRFGLETCLPFCLEVACYPCVSMGFHCVLRFPPIVQNMHINLKLAVDVM